jgi:uncharacterized membrane protein
MLNLPASFHIRREDWRPARISNIMHAIFVAVLVLFVIAAISGTSMLARHVCSMIHWPHVPAGVLWNGFLLAAVIGICVVPIGCTCAVRSWEIRHGRY